MKAWVYQIHPFLQRSPRFLERQCAKISDVLIHLRSAVVLFGTFLWRVFSLISVKIENKSIICSQWTYFNLISKSDLDDWLFNAWIMHSSSLHIIYLNSLCNNTFKFLFLLIRIHTNAFGRCFYPNRLILHSRYIHFYIGPCIPWHWHWCCKCHDLLFELQELNRYESDVCKMK